MTEYQLEFVEVLTDRDHLHLGTALRTIRRYGKVMGQFRKELEGVKHADALPEVLRVCGVTEHATHKRFVADLLQRDRWARNVFREALVGGSVENPYAFFHSEARMFSGQEVPGGMSFQELALNQKLDHPTPYDLDYGWEPGKRDVEDGTLLIKATRPDNGGAG